MELESSNLKHSLKDVTYKGNSKRQLETRKHYKAMTHRTSKFGTWKSSNPKLGRLESEG